MADESKNKPSLDASTVDDLARRTKSFFSDLARDYVKKPVDELLRWILRRATAYLVAGALFITAAVFLMVGIAGGLEELDVPSWAAALAVGTVGIVAGLIVLGAARKK